MGGRGSTTRKQVAWRAGVGGGTETPQTRSWGRRASEDGEEDHCTEMELYQPGGRATKKPWKPSKGSFQTERSNVIKRLIKQGQKSDSKRSNKDTIHD